MYEIHDPELGPDYLERKDGRDLGHSVQEVSVDNKFSQEHQVIADACVQMASPIAQAIEDVATKEVFDSHV